MNPDWLDDLNPAQREAVTHGDGPLLVVAGAGTGKTKTLACRVAWLIDQGTPPERICLLTFTRRAAKEMLARAGHLSAAAAVGQVWGGTFHAVANRLLRFYARAIGLGVDFTVMDQGDAADLMNLIRGEMGLASKKRRFPRKETLVAIYSRTVNAREKLSSVLRVHFPWCQEERDDIQAIFERYVDRKRQQNVLDYDDLLLYWHVLCTTPGIGDTVADRFDHVLVDEYQDTNAIQAETLLGMRRNVKNIMVVGDDAQSIYSFRAATVRNILDFPKQFPDTRVVTLEQNYRSVTPILDASNAVMEDAAERFTKNLWSNRKSEQKPVLVHNTDEPQQCTAVCERVLSHLEGGTALMKQAVLFRASSHSAQLEVELSRRNIPFHKYGGLKFIEAAHIKDMLAFLRILENPFDQISWYRVLQMLEGVGPRRARAIMEQLGVLEGYRGAVESPASPPASPTTNDASPGAPSLPGVGNGPRDDASAVGTDQASRVSPDTSAAPRPSPLRTLFSSPPDVPTAARQQFAQLRFALAECAGVSVGADPVPSDALAGTDASDGPVGPPLTTQVERMRAFYEPIFTGRYDNARMRLRDLEQLEHIAGNYRSRGRFITDLTLDPPVSTSDLAQPPHLDEDYLILSTIHSAKGCEWDVVQILHAADGMIPSDMAVGDQDGIDEERRLFYVAMTRARDWLYIHFPLRYYHHNQGLGDRHSYAQLTRFITRKVRPLLQEVAPNETDVDDGIATDGAAAERIQERLKSLWRE